MVFARAGSKGLKSKCIISLMGRMVIEYSISYSLSLGDNIKTIVSTDIPKVIKYCKENHIEYIKRNPDLCRDETKIDDAIADAIAKTTGEFEYSSIVYGNIPMRYPEIFHKSLRFLEGNKDYDAAISMQNVGKFNPQWMFNYDVNVLPKQKHTNHRRQALPQKMIHDGHTFLFKTHDFYKKFKGLEPYDKEYWYSVYGNKIKPIITDELIVDIDSEKDLEFAKAVMKQYKKLDKKT